MTESLPRPYNSGEKRSLKEEKEFISIVETMHDDLMDLDTLQGLDLDPRHDQYTVEESRQLFTWAQTEDFTEALEQAGYSENVYEPELPSQIALYRLDLMTPHFASIQHAIDSNKLTKSKTVVMELIEYNNALREAIRANPSLNAPTFSAHLVTSARKLVDFPDPMSRQIGDIINPTMAGARGELMTEQILTSEAVRDAGISFESTSNDDDAKGVDVRINVPLRSAQESIDVRLPIDVKVSQKQLKKVGGEYAEFFKVINRNRVVLWPQITAGDLDNGLLLSDYAVEAKGKKVAPVLKWAAQDYYEMTTKRTPRNLGQSAISA